MRSSEETRLTEREFQEAIGTINAIGQKTTPSHNEAMLMAGALGVSNLVCLLNNTQPTQANNLGPFYRAGAPRCADGASLLRSPTPGPRLDLQGMREGSRKATPSMAPRSTSGIHPRSACTRTRTPRRPR